MATKKSTTDEGTPEQPAPAVGDGPAPPRKLLPGVKVSDPKNPPTPRKLSGGQAKASNHPLVPHPDLYKARDELIKLLKIQPNQSRVIKSLSDPHRQSIILGVGIGLRYTKRTMSAEHVVKVFVSDKLRESDIDPADRVPNTIMGFRTDVEEASVARPQLADGPFPPPIPCGVTVAIQGGFLVGTIGCMVLMKSGHLCILSNNHILANQSGDAIQNASVGQPVLQPGPTSGNEIGRLLDFVPFRSDRPNFVDAAVAVLNDPGLVSPSHPKYTVNPPALDVQDLPHLTPLKINGTFSGNSVGQLVAVGINGIPFNYPNYPVPVLFQELIAISGAGGATFSGEGDSGSLVVTADTNSPVALLMGGWVSPDLGPVTVACPILEVMEELGIEMIISSENDFLEKP